MADYNEDDPLVYVCAYKCFFSNRSDIAKRNIILNLGDAIAILTYGKVERLFMEKLPQFKYTETGGGSFVGPPVAFRSSEKDGRLVLLLRGGDIDNSRRKDISYYEPARRYYAAIVFATLGISSVFEVEFEQFQHLKTQALVRTNVRQFSREQNCTAAGCPEGGVQGRTP